jgi:hypothetical protein
MYQPHFSALFASARRRWFPTRNLGDERPDVRTRLDLRREPAASNGH